MSLRRSSTLCWSTDSPHRYDWRSKTNRCEQVRQCLYVPLPFGPRLLFKPYAAEMSSAIPTYHKLIRYHRLMRSGVAQFGLFRKPQTTFCISSRLFSISKNETSTSSCLFSISKNEFSTSSCLFSISKNKTSTSTSLFLISKSEISISSRLFYISKNETSTSNCFFLISKNEISTSTSFLSISKSLCYTSNQRKKRDYSAGLRLALACSRTDRFCLRCGDISRCSLGATYFAKSWGKSYQQKSGVRCGYRLLFIL